MVNSSHHYPDGIEMAPQPIERFALLSLKHCLFLILALGAALHWFMLPKITPITNKTESTIIQDGILLPVDIAIRNSEMGSHSYTFIIDYSPRQQTRFNFYVQNCISSIMLNGFPVSYPLDRRCDFTNGINVELGRQLREGPNTLHVVTEGPGIALGPILFSNSIGGPSDILGCLMIGLACAALILFMERLTGERMTGYLLAGGFVLYLYILSHTTFMWKKYDMPQHLEYITFIANYFQWPSTYQGFLTYHPPLYYSIQAVLLLLANWLGSFEVVSVLRLFNVFFFMGFLIFVALTLRRLISHPAAYYITLLLLVTYPGGVVTSGRMDSNLLFYTCFSGCLYFLLCWLQDKQNRGLALSLAMCGLAMATRTNALLLLPIIGLAALYQWRHYHYDWAILKRWLKSRIIFTGLVVLLLGASINFGRPVYDNVFHNRNQSFLVANAGFLASIAIRLRIDNEWDNYLSFSLEDYFYPPYFSVWGGESRYYFWISALKSSMYGEFDYPNPWIAFYLNGLLLVFIAYIAATLIMNRRQLKQQPEWLMFLVTLFIPLAGLAANRILHPIACSQDFRYIYPAIASFCGFMGFSVERHLVSNRPLLAATGMVSVLCFAMLSLLFFFMMF